MTGGARAGAGWTRGARAKPAEPVARAAGLRRPTARCLVGEKTGIVRRYWLPWKAQIIHAPAGQVGPRMRRSRDQATSERSIRPGFGTHRARSNLIRAAVVLAMIGRPLWDENRARPAPRRRPAPPRRRHSVRCSGRARDLRTPVRSVSAPPASRVGWWWTPFSIAAPPCEPSCATPIPTAEGLSARGASVVCADQDDAVAMAAALLDVSGVFLMTTYDDTSGGA